MRQYSRVRERESLLKTEREIGHRDPSESWYVECCLATENDFVFGNPDEDGHYFLSSQGPELSEVGPYLPVRVRIYRRADKDTVLKMLDKMRAEVERCWAEWEAERAAKLREAQQRKPVEPGRSDVGFGVCPYCEGQDGYLNVGRVHWMKCDKDRTKWCIGSNLLSGWRYEDEATWKENAQRLATYEEVEPAFPGRSDDPEPSDDFVW